jgi:ubiquinone/menaquinone biosynthesis C-methylase UbiE
MKWQTPAAKPEQTPQKPRYEYRSPHDPNGTGQFYMGREIAQVMGHEGADWLDRPEREAEEAPSLLIKAMKLRKGMNVADIGAGSGYFTFRIAPQVAPGKVFAVDIQPEMLAIIKERQREKRLDNIVTVLGKVDDPKLETASCDLIFLVDVYHEFDHPYEMTEAMVKALKPGGRLLLVEYRMEDPRVPIKVVHKMSEAQVRKEMAIFPLRFVGNNRILPRQHIFIFEKTG